MTATEVARPRLSLWLAAAGCLLLPAAPCATADAATVRGVRTWTAPDQTRIVLDLSGPADYQARRVGGPDRIAVEIAGAQMAESGPLDVRDGLVRSVRRVPLRGGAQIVIDLEGPAAGWRHFRLPSASDRPDRIVIDILRQQAVAPAAPAPAPPAAPSADSLTEAAKTPAGAADPGGTPADAGQVGAVAPPGAAPDDAGAVAAAQPARPFVVIIDPGHGGMDPGAIRGGWDEKDITLGIARELARQIDALPGYRAVLTRKGDYFVSLGDRVRIAQREKGDVFISIHCNTHRQRSMDGMEVYFLSLQGATDREAQELADAENAADLVGLAPDEARDDSVLSILMDLRMTLVLDQSSRLAESILGAARGSGLVSARRVKQARFQVLRSLAMPSALVELAYLSNAADRELLTTGTGRRRFASLVARGLLAYRGAGRAAAGAALEPGSGPATVPGAGTAAGDRGRAWNLKYRVRRGDTLEGLAARHGTTIDAIRRHNDLRSRQLLAGQTLRLPGGD